MSAAAWDKILVGFDFSKEAETAVGHAFTVASQTGSQVVLAHAAAFVPGVYYSAETAAAVAGQLDSVFRDALIGVEARLSEVRDRYEKEGHSLEHVLIEALPDTGLPDKAAELGAGLIVVGTHGNTGFRRVLLGSVAERVVRLSDVDVMVARGEAKASYQRVLVASDFSPSADLALERATRLVGDDGVIDLIHCWQPPSAAIGYWSPQPPANAYERQLREQLIEMVHEQANYRLNKHKNARYRLQFQEVEDSPSHGIHRALESGDYDVLVMGSHGRRGVRRFLLGSVAESTARHAPCPVVVVHGTQDSSQKAE